MARQYQFQTTLLSQYVRVAETADVLMDRNRTASPDDYLNFWDFRLFS
jgi:hypothetical protein